MSCLFLRLKSRLEKDEISAGPNNTFCTTPPPVIHRRFKHHKRTKINKKNSFCLPSSVFYTKFTISVLKSNKYSILTVTELRAPVSESSTGSQTFISPTDSEKKIHKTRIENPIHRIQSPTHNHNTMFHH